MGKSNENIVGKNNILCKFFLKATKHIAVEKHNIPMNTRRKELVHILLN